MEFLTGLLASIIRPIIQHEIEELKNWFVANQKLAADVKILSAEAKGLMDELENAQSESERKAILRKISNFASLNKLRL